MIERIAHYPKQKLPMSQKDDDWKRACVDFFIGSSYIGRYNGRTISERQQINYELYNSRFNRKDLEYVTNPFGVDEEQSFPANIQNFNIIRPKIDLLLGEEIKRPFNWRVIQTNPEATSRIERQKRDMLLQYVMGEISKEINLKAQAQQLQQKQQQQQGQGGQQQGGQPNIGGAGPNVPSETQLSSDFEQQLEQFRHTLDPEFQKLGQMQKTEPVTNPKVKSEAEQMAQLGATIPSPPEIEKYMRYSYKDIYEHAAHSALNYLFYKLDLEEEFIRGFKDALITGTEVYYVGNKEDEPYAERCNPIFFDFDKDPELYHIEKGEWAVRKIRMTPSGAYDRFKDILSEDDLDELLKGQYSISTNANDVNYRFIRKEFQGDSFENLAANLINVYHATWKSYKKVGYLKYKDEFGQEQTTVVDETYKKAKGEKIEWDWIVEVWEGYRFGQNIYAGIRPTDYTCLPYVGLIYSRTNSVSVSLVDLMKPIQYMYIIVWYRLELMLARDKGKVINIDVTQIPKSLGIDFAKWAHYLSAMGINLINPWEEGFDVARQGHEASFNQFGSIDLTVANVINEYVKLLDKLEDMIGEISGVSRQRQGAIANSEQVGNVEKALTQSSLITEQSFWQHSKCKQRVMMCLLNVAKKLWEGKEQKLQFMMDDFERKVFTVPTDFAFNEYDIFISNSAKDTKILESLRALAQPALQSGATLYDVAQMYMTDDIAEMKHKIQEIDEKKLMLAQIQREMQMQMEEKKLQAQVDMREAMVKQREDDSIRKANAMIEVAMIQAQEPQASEIPVPEGIEDNQLEEQKVANDRLKVQGEQDIKRKQLENEMKQHQDQMRLKEKEITSKEKIAKQKPKGNAK